METAVSNVEDEDSASETEESTGDLSSLLEATAHRIFVIYY